MFIHQHKRQWPIVVRCKILFVHPSGYYAWLRRPASEPSAQEQALLLAIREIHTSRKQTVGSRRMV